MEVNNEIGKSFKITLNLKGIESIKQLPQFIENKMIPLQEKYPYVEIHIEVSA